MKMSRRTMLTAAATVFVPIPMPKAPVPLATNTHSLLEHALYLHALYQQNLVSKRTVDRALDIYLCDKFGGLMPLKEPGT